MLYWVHMKKNTQVYKKWWFWVLITLFILILVGNLQNKSTLNQKNGVEPLVNIQADNPVTDNGHTEQIIEDETTNKEQTNKAFKEIEFVVFMDEMVNLEMIVKYEIDQNMDYVYLYMTPEQWSEVPNKKDFTAGIFVQQKEAVGMYAVSIHNYYDFNDQFSYADRISVRVEKY